MYRADLRLPARATPAVELLSLRYLLVDGLTDHRRFDDDEGGALDSVVEDEGTTVLTEVKSSRLLPRIGITVLRQTVDTDDESTVVCVFYSKIILALY